MIRLEGVGKRYADGTVAVQELDLEIEAGEMVVLVGPSGCGKSTTLKMINRLIEPTTGRIFVEGRDVMAEDPVKMRRRIGYVIQQIGLFPNKTVEDNICVVPDLLGWDRVSDPVRDTLQNHDYGSATLDLKDGRIADVLNGAKPAGIPFQA